RPERACSGTGPRRVPLPANLLQEGFPVLGERAGRGRCRPGCASFRLQAFRAVQSLAIPKSSFTVPLRISSRARVQPFSCAAGDLSAFDPLLVAFRLGTNEAFP